MIFPFHLLLGLLLWNTIHNSCAKPNSSCEVDHVDQSDMAPGGALDLCNSPRLIFFTRLAFEVSYGAPSATPTMVSHEGTAETVVPEPIDATVNTVATTDTAVTTNTMAPQLKRPTQTMMGTTTQVKISVEGVKDSGKAMTNTANL